MPDRAFLEHGKVGRAAADIEQGDPDFLFFVVENSVTGGEGLQHHVGHLDVRPLDALVNVFRGAHESRNDMHAGFHADAAHPERIVYAVLAVHDELLRDDMDDFSVRREGEALRVLDQPVDVGLGDFVLRAADAHHPAALEALDVIARDPDDRTLNMHPRLRLRLRNRGGDRVRGPVDVRDHAAVHAVRGASTHSKDVNATLFIRAGHHGAHFSRTDVETDNVVHHGFTLSCNASSCC